MAFGDDMCRLCASSGNRCIPVFGDDGIKTLLVHKLRVCSPVIVKDKDLLPKQVCLSCLSSLDQCYEFYQQSKTAQLKLHALFEMESNKGKMPDCENDSENIQRFNFGDTVLSYSSVLNDQNNATDMTNESGKSPLFVIMKRRLETVSDNCAGSLDKNPSSTVTQTVTNPANANASHTNVDPKKKKTTQAVMPLQPPSTQECALQTPKEEILQKNKESHTLPIKQEPLPSMEKVTLPQTVKPSPNQVAENSNKHKLSPPKKSLSLSKSSGKQNDGFSTCHLCDRQFPTELLEGHKALHYGRNLYFCDQCTKTFITEEAFKKHVKRHEAGH